MKSNDQPDDRLDDLPKDDASIELLSESGDSHAKDSDWSIYSAGRNSVAGSNVTSMDFQKLNIHSRMAKIVHHDGRQFIERRDLDDGGLPYSAEFYLNDELWKLNGEDCLLQSPRRYIAMVSVDGTVDLEGAADFDEAVRMLLKHLKVVKVLLDKQLEECNKAKSVLQMILDKLTDESGKNIHHKRDVMLLRILLQKHGNSLAKTFKLDLKNCSRLPSATRMAVDNYVTLNNKLIQRNEILGHLNDSSLSEGFINDAVQKALTTHRSRLAVICPSTLLGKLKELPDDHILYVSEEDMNLFNYLTTLDHTMFETVLPIIFSKFLKKIENNNDEQFANLDPLSNRIFLYVCKSLQDVAEQLGAHTQNDKTLIYNEALGWEVSNLQEESQTAYSKCLRQQLQMLAMLANHFEPGGPFRTSRFPYEFKLFQSMDGIPEPVRIWLCLLDDCMKDLVQADMDKMQMLSCFFKSYVSFIASEEFHGETLECLRRITHDALQSLADMKLTSQQDRGTSDSDFLEYNDLISPCLNKFLCEHFGNDCDQIQATLRRIINQVMNKNITSEESTEFSDAFKQLLKDISELPLEWYLQLPPSENRNLLVRSQFIVPVDNRWKDTEHESLKVVDPEGFVKFYKFLNNGEEIPKHYQLKVIQLLLDKLAAKQSCYEGKLRLDKHQLGTMTDMINSIRSSILCLNRQPDYSCFEDFLQKMGESFSHSIEEKRSLEGFRNPMSSANDLKATEPPHTDPIDVGEPLDPLLDIFEESISKERLAAGLKIYTTQFNKHLREPVQLSREKRIEQIVSDVVLKVKPQLATSWTEEFKRDELPEVLAGLSAVWSLIVSKNDNSSEKLTEPSSLQISCVLSFFGDQNHNDDNLHRLLYISTQQGKKLVIGLTAALLALYGHKVLIACYNGNLVRRNSKHLIDVFKAFTIEHNISYGCVEDMARERSREVYEKYSAYKYECVGIEFRTNNDNKLNDAFQLKRSVLLIEDIDMLLLTRTLGQALKRFVRPTIPGLALLQKNYLREYFSRRGIYQFITLIKQIDNPEMRKFMAFLDNNSSYVIDDKFDYSRTTYTNQSLFEKHANNYEKRFNLHSRPYFRLARKGVMMVKTMEDYCCEADVLCLLLEPFGKGFKNYGYLTVGNIPFPYAHMLRSYPLVFGFACTLLDDYEELTIHNHYDIYHKIAKSNPLQTTPIKFDSKKDFLCVDSSNRCDWMSAVMIATNSAIERNCSVLVFFKSDLEMVAFQNEFSLPLKRLSVTAIVTASNGENITEDDIAVDEVTVLAIERNGDSAADQEVHVIQTFFSDDGKEENLIRRQAERSHGSGSYELIVCREHVYIPEKNINDEVTYELLVQLRKTRTFEGAMKCLTEYMRKYRERESYCK